MMGFRTSFRSFFVAVLSPLGYKGKNGTGQRVNADSPLTTNPLLSKGESWLPVRLNPHLSNVQVTATSQRSKGRLFHWSKLTTTPAQSSSCLRTIPCSDSTSISSHVVFPQLSDRKKGNWKSIKKWRPIYSPISTVK